jgi:hypothetical protein
MRDDKKPDDYEVGYGKPPKNTRFQKGRSGNPKGRPRKSLDFYAELIKESNSLITITENGQQKHISKHNVAIKQLMTQAMTGRTHAQRIYFPLRQQELETVALMAGSQPNTSKKSNNAKDYTREELRMIIAEGLEKRKKEGGE